MSKAVGIDLGTREITDSERDATRDPQRVRSTLSQLRVRLEQLHNMVAPGGIDSQRGDLVIWEG